MTNIPTELLRTLIRVVDMRSFTKAAQSLGVTQPAVSAQIKRLQSLLGADLLDKSAPGVSLTSSGELVVNYARRLLSINDQILDLAGPRTDGRTIRIGASRDFAAAGIALGLTRSRLQRPELRFVLSDAPLEQLLRDLHDGELDIVVGVAKDAAVGARHGWSEEVVWLYSDATRIAHGQPVPLVSYGEHCLLTRHMIQTLGAAGREFALTFVSSSIAGLGAAVAAGFGVTALPRSRADIPGVAIWDDAPLPRQPDIHCGIYTREGCDPQDLEQVADMIAAALRPAPARTRIDASPKYAVNSGN